MDDFLFAEPQAVPSRPLLVLVGSGLGIGALNWRHGGAGRRIPGFQARKASEGRGQPGLRRSTSAGGLSRWRGLLIRFGRSRLRRTIVPRWRPDREGALCRPSRRPGIPWGREPVLTEVGQCQWIARTWPRTMPSGSGFAPSSGASATRISPDRWQAAGPWRASSRTSRSGTSASSCCSTSGCGEAHRGHRPDEDERDVDWINDAAKALCLALPPARGRARGVGRRDGRSASRRCERRDHRGQRSGRPRAQLAAGRPPTRAPRRDRRSASAGPGLGPGPGAAQRGIDGPRAGAQPCQRQAGAEEGQPPWDPTEKGLYVDYPRQSAARAEAAGEPRQVRVAGRAQDALGRAAAEVAVAAERQGGNAPRKAAEHRELCARLAACGR